MAARAARRVRAGSVHFPRFGTSNDPRSAWHDLSHGDAVEVAAALVGPGEGVGLALTGGVGDGVGDGVVTVGEGDGVVGVGDAEWCAAGVV